MELSTQEKGKYLLRCWGFVEITRDAIKVPIFDSNGFFQRFVIKPIESYCCRNYSVKRLSIVHGEKPFVKKEFRGSSVEEVITLAYKNARIGEQLDLFIKEKIK